MTDIARKVSMTAGKDHIARNEGVQQILHILRERFAPDAIDAINRGVAKFMNFETNGPNDGCVSGEIRRFS